MDLLPNWSRLCVFYSLELVRLKDDQKVGRRRREPASQGFRIDLDADGSFDIGLGQLNMGWHFCNVGIVVFDDDVADPGCAELVVGIQDGEFRARHGSGVHSDLQFFARIDIEGRRTFCTAAESNNGHNHKQQYNFCERIDSRKDSK